MILTILRAISPMEIQNRVDAAFGGFGDERIKERIVEFLTRHLGDVMISGVEAHVGKRQANEIHPQRLDGVEILIREIVVAVISPKIQSLFFAETLEKEIGHSLVIEVARRTGALHGGHPLLNDKVAADIGPPQGLNVPKTIVIPKVFTRGFEIIFVRKDSRVRK